MSAPFEIDVDDPMFRAACERLELTQRQIDGIARAIYMQARAGEPPRSPVAVAIHGRLRSVAIPRLWVRFEIRGDRILLRDLSERPTD